MKQMLLTGVVGALVLVFAAGAFSQAFQRRPFWEREETAARLELTEAQKRQLAKIDERYRQEIGEIQNQLREAQLEFTNALSKKEISRYDLEGLIEEISTLQAQVTKLTLQQRIAIREVLSAEQQAQLNLSESERRGRAREGAERRRTPDRFSEQTAGD